jgi:hypothetical protein
MRKVKVLFGFIKLQVAKKIEFARNTVSRMTGNTSFPTPDVPLTQLTTATNNLETAYNAAQGGGKQQKAAMRAAEVILNDLLHKQAAYVDRIAAGNETLILGAGFECTAQPKSADLPEFTVKNGEKSGEMILKHKGVKGAKVWVWRYCKDPLSTNEWVLAGITTQATFVIKDLTPGVKYWFDAAYVTIKGQSDYCDPYTKIAV